MIFGVEMMPRKGRINFFRVKYSHSNVMFLTYMDLGKLRYIGNFSFSGSYNLLKDKGQRQVKCYTAIVPDVIS